VGGREALGVVQADSSVLAASLGPTKTFLSPDPPGSLAVDPPALSEQQLVSLAPAPAGVAFGDLAQTVTELVLLGSRGLGTAALGGAVLAHQRTGSALGDPETLGQGHHGPPAALRGQ
jgi:hypothetical protein